MAMIFKQFMFGSCCEMYIKFKFVAFIFILFPLLTISSNVRNRRRPAADGQVKDTEAPFTDQIALATSFEPGQLISAHYAVNQEPGNYRHGNLVVNLIQHPDDEENRETRPMYYTADDGLSESKTAEEYVSKALQIHGSAGESPTNPQTILVPKSTIAKYEVYEEQTEPPEPIMAKDSVTRSSFDRYEYDASSNSFHRQQPQVFNELTTERYATVRPQYEAKPSTLQQLRVHTYSEPNEKIQTAPSTLAKEDILKHIEESVIKYMKMLESEGKLQPSTTTQRPVVYYRIQEVMEPKKTTSNVRISNNAQSEIDFKSQIQKPTVIQTVKAASKEPDFGSESPLQEVMDNLHQNIEFIYKTRTRSPKITPTQNNFEHVTALRNIQELEQQHPTQEQRSTKPKLYFNTNTYQDINSLLYKPEKGVIRPNQPEAEFLRAEHRGVPSTKLESSPSSSFISITDHLKKGLSDGYPAANPYRYVFNDQQSGSSSRIPESNLQAQSSSWQPYVPGRQNVLHQDPLNYDSYSPKFNNNPEGEGYQHNYKPPEGLSSFTSNRLVKRGKRGGHKTTTTVKPKRGVPTSSGRKKKDPNTSLRPPPFHAKD